MSKVSVSGSEVNTAQLCQRQALYAFHPAYNLEPATLGPALTRGNIGHKALEIYYGYLKEGIDPPVAAKQTSDRMMLKGMELLQKGDSQKAEMLANLQSRLNEYFEFYKNELDDFEILGVEQLIRFELDSDMVDFVGRVDLVIKYKRGPYRGETAALDHKFVYNFWPENAYLVNAQMPNYIYGIRKEYPDAVVRRAVVNQIRYREDAVEKFKREAIIPTREEATELIRNHTLAAERWVSIKQLPVAEARLQALRNPSKFNCQYCHFVRLCKAELTQQDTRNMIKLEFKSNSYGYADRDDE